MPREISASCMHIQFVHALTTGDTKQVPAAYPKQEPILLQAPYPKQLGSSSL